MQDLLEVAGENWSDTMSSGHLLEVGPPRPANGSIPSIMDPEAKKHVGKYSLGMRQRLGIAQTIMEEPSLLILDEPMNGLDNQGVQEMRQLFLKLKEEGKTILLASHNREDIAALCDTTVEIDRGKITKTRT